MKRLLVGLLAVILLLLAGITVLAFRAIQDTPLVTGDGVLSPSAVSRAKTVIRLNDPRRLRPGTNRESRILAADLETLVNLALRRGQATVVLEDGLADLRYTLAMPATPLGRYLNLWARVAVGPEGVEFHKVRVGSVPIPGPLFRMGLDYAIGKSELAPDLALLRQTIHHVAFVPGELRIRYTWKPEILDSARARVLSQEDRERLAATDDRCGLLPRPERVSESGHVRIRTDSGIPEQVPRAADTVAFLQNRETLCRGVLLQLARRSDSGQSGSDDDLLVDRGSNRNADVEDAR